MKHFYLELNNSNITRHFFEKKIYTSGIYHNHKATTNYLSINKCLQPGVHLERKENDPSFIAMHIYDRSSYINGTNIPTNRCCEKRPRKHSSFSPSVGFSYRRETVIFSPLNPFADSSIYDAFGGCW